jgi:thiol:disulfide interchange protein DsbD
MNRSLFPAPSWRHLLGALLAWLTLGLGGARAADFLEPEKAFPLSATAVGPDVVELRFAIADGYYLYRERFKFEATGATLGEAQLPHGKVKFDETFQKDVETYRGELRIRVPVAQAAAAAFDLAVTAQGCADAGLCYPPMTQHLRTSLRAFGGNGSTVLVSETGEPLGAGPVGQANTETGLLAAAQGGSPAAVKQSEQPQAADNAVERVLRSGSWWATLGAFGLMGLLLAFTPCVLPMLPILSSIIAGGGDVSRQRGFMLALAYSLGMAMVYTALGIAAGLAGEGLAAALQKPWVLATFGLLLFGLSLAMFDVYELRLPHAFSNHLDGASRRLPGGRLLGVFLMGGLSALIVSPCVTAPLAGALVFLSQTRDVALAGTALFALAMGMSVPLLLLGASAGAWLPSSGVWMHAVKRFFGLVLIAVALWVLQPVLPAWAQLSCWGGLLLVTGFMLRPFDANPHSGAPRVWLQRAAGVAALALGVMQLAGAASGGANPLQPLAHLAGGCEPALAPLPFRMVHSVDELDGALAAAGRPVMLDFYADWCVSCKEMERFTFQDPAVRQRLAGALLLKADVTANTADDKALLQRFKLFGPPGTIFFNAQGVEQPALRVVGYSEARAFENTLQAVGL